MTSPTLGTGVSSLPSEGALAALGRPGGGSAAGLPLLSVHDLHAVSYTHLTLPTKA